MDLKESIDFSWMKKFNGDRGVPNKEELINQRNRLLGELMQQTQLTPNGNGEKRGKLLSEIKELMQEINEFGKENEENEFKTVQLAPEREEDDLTTRMLPELPEDFSDDANMDTKTNILPGEMRSGQNKADEILEQENIYFLQDSLYELFADVWADDFDQNRFEKLKQEIESRFENLDDRRELIQGYIDDHRFKSRIFLNLAELICFKTTKTVMREKPEENIEFYDEELIRELDDTFYNFIALDLNKDEDEFDNHDLCDTEEQEEKYLATTDIDNIIQIIDQDKRSKEEMANYLSGYYSDLKQKIKYFYKIANNLCEKPLDVIFEPGEKLTERELKIMLEDFGFGKYLFDIIEFEGIKHKSNKETSKTTAEPDRSNEAESIKVKPIAYDSSEIKTIGNARGGQKVFYQFENPLVELWGERIKKKE